MDERVALGVSARLLACLVVCLASTGLAAQSQGAPPRPSAISGVVTDAITGAPIAAATVQVSISTGAPAATIVRQVTDRRGRFVFMDLPPGNRVTVSATANGYASGGYGLEDGIPGEPVRLTLAADQWLRDIEVRLTRLATVSGVALDEHSEPLVGVWVRLLARRIVAGQPQWIGGPATTTDDRGMFRMASVPDGTYVAMMISPMASLPSDAPGIIQNTAPPSIFGGFNSLPPPARTDLLQSHGDGPRLVLGHGVPVLPPDVDGTVRVYPTTFNPGVTSVEAATAFTVRRGQDVSGVTIVSAPVPAVSVSGTVAVPPGLGWHGRVLRLVPATLAGILSGVEVATTAARLDGSFTFPLVPEGDYLLDAPGTFLEVQLTTERSGPPPPSPAGLRYSSGSSGALMAFPGLTYSRVQPTVPQEAWVRLPVSVGRRSIRGLVVTPQPTRSLAGTFEFEGTVSATIENTTGGGGAVSGGGTVTVRTSAPAAIQLVLEPAGGESWLGMPRSESPDGPTAFTIAGLYPGRYVIRAGNPTRYALMHASLDGRDVTTEGFDASELTGRESLVVRVTDKLAAVTGTVIGATTDASGSVYVFPADAAAWKNVGLNPPGFRRGAWQSGQPFTIGALPAGTYLMLATTREAANTLEWTSAAWLERAAPLASRVTVNWEQTATISLSPVVSVPAVVR